MTEKHYRYPPAIKFSKAVFLIIMILLPMAFGWLLLSNYSFSHEEYKIITITLILGIPMCMYTIGSICEVKTNDNGLYIDFFWKYMFVPWDGVEGIKYIGFRPFGYWVILTNNYLTVFHRLYSIGAFPLLPGFQIHENLESREILLSDIRKKISMNKKNSPRFINHP